MKIILKKILWLPAFIWTMAIFYLGSIPAPAPILPFPAYDKILHFGTFGLLTILFALPRNARPLWFWLIFVPAVIGASLELMQLQIPFREADIFDWLADILGSFVSFIFILFINRVYANRKH